MSNTVELVKALISRPSITPDDQGCQQLILSRLAAIGFNAEPLRFGEVDNLWARRGTQGPLFVFAGHSDVVPAGDLNAWTSDPFSPEIRNGMLYGRGAADMKTGLAAMITATETFVAEQPDHKGSIGFLITSDEEGQATDGTVRVVETLNARQETIDWCLIGEPSSTDRLGDTIKNGRRGSHNAKLTIYGKQGHIAYPHLAENPIHIAIPALAELTATQWDQGNAFFPPTSFQMSNIHAGTGVENVIPGTLEIMINFRFSTELTANKIESKVAEILDKHRLDYRIEWRLSGHPFLTKPGTLVEAASKAVKKITGNDPQCSTSGGTSDGRFIALTGAQVLELGPVNATIHQVNECVVVADIEPLSNIYLQILRELLGK